MFILMLKLETSVSLMGPLQMVFTGAFHMLPYLGNISVISRPASKRHDIDASIIGHSHSYSFILPACL